MGESLTNNPPVSQIECWWAFEDMTIDGVIFSAFHTLIAN